MLYQYTLTYAGYSAAVHKEDILIILISESLTFGLHLSKIPTPVLASENERAISFEEDVMLVLTKKRKTPC
jgi:hypothetical protein